MRRDFDVLVLGGGAAGLMCAIEAGKRGRKVAVLERAERIGKKILISGGGRCNFTNRYCSPASFLSSNPHFCKSALARYTPDDFVSLIKKHRIPYHEKTLGQLFCDNSARDVVAMLEAECRQAGVQIFTGMRIGEISHDVGFAVEIEHQNLRFKSPALVIATGGLSIPKMGATAFGYELAKQFGIAVKPCRPALVPLTFSASDRERYCDLAGVSAEVIAVAKNEDRSARRPATSPAFREKMLITHRGLSGPAILQVSSYLQSSAAISIDLAPEKEVFASLQKQPSHRG